MQAVHRDVPPKVVGVTEENEEFLPEVEEEVADEGGDFLPGRGKARKTRGQKGTNFAGERHKRRGELEESCQNTDEDSVQPEEVRGDLENPGGNGLFLEEREKKEENHEAQRVQRSSHESQRGCLPKGKSGFCEDIDFSDIPPLYWQG